jgi:O-antigen/teichoic acid export membrane protein
MRSYLILLYLALSPIAFLGMAFSGSVIGLVYGTAMLPAVFVSKAYFAVAWILAFNAPVGMILYARGKTPAALVAYLIFSSVNLLLDILLIPRFALVGAVIALSVAKLLNLVLFARIAWSEFSEIRVPWAFLTRVGFACAPVLLWWLVEGRLASPLAIVGGVLAGPFVLVMTFRIVRVVGKEEAEIIRQSKLPLTGPALRILFTE